MPLVLVAAAAAAAAAIVAAAGDGEPGGAAAPRRAAPEGHEHVGEQHQPHDLSRVDRPLGRRGCMRRLRLLMVRPAVARDGLHLVQGHLLGPPCVRQDRIGRDVGAVELFHLAGGHIEQAHLACVGSAESTGRTETPPAAYLEKKKKKRKKKHGWLETH